MPMWRERDARVTHVPVSWFEELRRVGGIFAEISATEI